MEKQLDIRFVGNMVKVGDHTGRQVSSKLTAALKKTSAYMSDFNGVTTRVWIGGVDVFVPRFPTYGGDIEQIASELEALGFIVTQKASSSPISKPTLSVAHPSWF
jgi:hypothetical protein